MMVKGAAERLRLSEREAFHASRNAPKSEAGLQRLWSDPPELALILLTGAASTAICIIAQPSTDSL